MVRGPGWDPGSGGMMRGSGLVSRFRWLVSMVRGSRLVSRFRWVVMGSGLVSRFRWMVRGPGWYPGLGG